MSPLLPLNVGTNDVPQKGLNSGICSTLGERPRLSKALNCSEPQLLILSEWTREDVPGSCGSFRAGNLSQLPLMFPHELPPWLPVGVVQGSHRIP